MHKSNRAKFRFAAVGALCVSLLIAFSQAAPPRPPARRRAVARRRAAGHPPRRAVARRRRRVLHRRRAQSLSRAGRTVVLANGTKVVRPLPAPLVVTSASGLKTVPAPDTSGSIAYKVVRVDSDCTAVLDMNGKKTKVRLIGVETGSTGRTGSSGAARAREALKTLIGNEFVHLKYDSSLAEKDEEGNIAAYLYRAPDGMLVNLELIRQGAALAATDYDYEHKGVCAFYERKARTDGKGIWEGVATTKDDTSDPNPHG